MNKSVKFNFIVIIVKFTFKNIDFELLVLFTVDDDIRISLKFEFKM